MSARAQTLAGDLLAWFDTAAVALPWRVRSGDGEPDAYRVWLAEVMLQQTTVAAAAPYWQQFVARWPSVEALAAAPEEDVLSAWAGLGYYSRARNLLATATRVAAAGGFPATESALRQLPGVGAYTAAAVAAIAFGQRAVVVDGNVERVVARLFAIGDSLPGARPLIRARMDSITPDERCGDFAQAVMDLGRLVCRPRAPACGACPVSSRCAAFRLGLVDVLPRKNGRSAPPERRGRVFVLHNRRAVWLVRRPPRGLFARMHALPTDGWSASADGAAAAPVAADWQDVGTLRHTLSHARLVLTVHRAEAADALPAEGEWWPLPTLPDAGLPTVCRNAVRLAFSSQDPSAEHQAQHGDDEHDQAQVATRVPPRQGADHHARQRHRQDKPVAPPQKRNGRRDRHEQGDKADEDRNDVEHHP
ncbi:A/G-specific adenine glycosylase [Erythrobacteraceae bacterium CFH 75059]|uniref:A/G-specific adenine glycosylase n=1 Tax=Qipengyuania thermophila TaxID=2509361 RepID=UPI00101FFD5A|nr:A/G-specific adenine glycosylase [Qipengyuania thermophila]TCD04882.1 A/G-specific adenine glycosylase [Erythrobacteraceae bacterium CFH 75059]